MFGGRVSWVLGYHSFWDVTCCRTGKSQHLEEWQCLQNITQYSCNSSSTLSFASSTPRTGLFDHEDEGIMTLKNIGNNLPNDTVAHPRMLVSSAIPMWTSNLTTSKYYRLELCVIVRVLSDVCKDGGQAVHEEKLQCSCPTIECHVPPKVRRHHCANHNLATFKYQSISPLLQKCNSH
jgi:hypothetical protein